MMDALARLAPAAVELLDRVDHVLATAGAPAGHPIWPLLRRLRALPGQAVAALADGRPGPVVDARDTLTALVEEYRRLGAGLPAATDWQGAGADSFAVQWLALRAHLDDDLGGHLRATASYLDALESWQVAVRDTVARTLARVLGSVEAVRVWTATGEQVRVATAAADIAVPVLDALIEAYQNGERLVRDWAERLGEVSYRPPTLDRSARPDGTTRVTL